MKKDLLTVKELAAELHMSQKSIQRAYRKEEIPVQWLGRMARFNLAKVQRAMERNGRSRMRCLNGIVAHPGAIAGASRRRARNSPRLVTRGRYLQGFLQEFYGFYNVYPVTVHPYCGLARLYPADWLRPGYDTGP
ncbi:MAG: helix-turn-helix domain-containing protein [Nitrospiraceae bacterium]|nr:helix-turn-helix domain-containing protein [Nitrospiraceae bacterium]